MLAISVEEKDIRLGLANFLEAKLKIHPASEGRSLLVQVPITHKEARRLIKRFLHDEGVEDEYRIISLPQGLVIQRRRTTARRRRQEGTPPPPSRTLPYFFP